MFGQSWRCTETPLPRVMYPIILSPGTGLQQREYLIKHESSPDTITPSFAFDFCVFEIFGGSAESIFVAVGTSVFAHLLLASSLSFVTALRVGRLPYPTALYKSSKDANPYRLKMVLKFSSQRISDVESP